MPSTSSTGSPGLLLEPGRVDYSRALALQRRLVEQRRRDEIPDTLVLLEHPPVITIGRNADRRNLLVTEQELARRGVELHQVERGGDVTFHGPGQLVGYPVFRLRGGAIGVRRFVELVEQALIRALAGLGVTAGLNPGGIGVWVGPRKLASLGVAVRRGVTFHGFALNVTTDLDWFRLMNPCGMGRVEMTSVEREGGRTEPGAVRDAVVRAFEAEFGREFRPASDATWAGSPSGILRHCLGDTE
ncbi:MAG: lipoyl(octanoyl) transferase LipB [bacterium]